jgi:broad specificity phosphatase PhoE
MLSNTLPFEVNSIAEAIEEHQKPVDVLCGNTRSRWGQIPENARNLVQGLLQRNARNRFSVDQALEHSFIQRVSDGAAPRGDQHGRPESPGNGTSDFYHSCRKSAISKFSWSDPHGKELDLRQISKTIYFIRHGEASHNIAEKKAKRNAAKKALEMGIERASKEFEEAVEEARKAVLHNEDFFDAMLSVAGQQDAERCRCELAGLCDRGLPMPTVVFTSPLQRTLQTAAAVFPHHSNVHALEEVRERRTGLPCDSRSKRNGMISRPSFFNIDFNRIDDEEDTDFAENKAEARERCARFLRDLPGTDAVDESGAKREHNSICVVSHKGFLREMERGPLGHPEATEFMNCEVRVYEVRWTPEGEVEMPAKLLYSNASLSTLQMQNFPASWVTPESLEELPRRVKALLAEFGDLREPGPEVWQAAEGGLRVTAAFTEQSAAAAAALRLHGLDIRGDDEKRSRPTAYSTDRFHAQLLYDVL